MSRFKMIALAAATLIGGCATDYGSRDRYADDGWGYYDRGYSRQNGSYDYNRPDPRDNGYYAERYYRQDSRYRERYMNENDRIYRGRDGRYYCRRSDGSTGLIVGAISGGILGNIIAEGDSKPLGTVLGAIGGAAVGAAIDSRSNNRVACR